MTDDQAAEIICRVYDGKKYNNTEYGAAIEYIVTTKEIYRFKEMVEWAKRKHTA